MMITMRNCFITALALLFLSAGAFAGQSNRCTQRTVVGTYAVMAEGTTIMTLEDGTQIPVPVASLTIATINPEGEASSSGYIAVGDQMMRVGIEPGDPVMSSEITINSDCTGIERLGHGPVVELIVRKGGDEISSIMVQGGPLGSPVITGKWKRISRKHNIYRPHARWAHSISGTYTVHMTGFFVVPGLGPVPGGFLSRASIEYDGTIAMSGTAMPAGNPMPFTLSDGVWEKDELSFTYRASGTIMVDGIPGGQVESWMVALDGGNEFWGIEIGDPAGSPVFLITGDRTSRRPSNLE